MAEGPTDLWHHSSCAVHHALSTISSHISETVNYVIEHGNCVIYFIYYTFRLHNIHSVPVFDILVQHGIPTYLQLYLVNKEGRINH